MHNGTRDSIRVHIQWSLTHRARDGVCGLAGGRTVSPLVAFRVARFAKVSVDDVLAGRFH